LGAVRFLLVLLLMFVVANAADASLAIYSSKESGTFTESGGTSKVLKTGIWIVDMDSNISAEIVLFPKLGRMYGGTFPVLAYFVDGPKGQIVAFARGSANNETSLSAQLYTGAVSMQFIGGTSPVRALPKTIKGTSWLIARTVETGSLSLQQTTSTLTLNTKVSQYYNFLGVTLDQVAALFLDDLRMRGYTLQFWTPFSG
jgi:hypothetical protein